jgi:putative CocE/NonD family hydrolase
MTNRTAGPKEFAVASIRLDKDVEIPMRDGTVTRANVYRPDGDQKVPAILVRTPYSKDLFLAQVMSLDPIRAVESGIAVVFQDLRGRYASDGELTMFQESEDGYDSVEWLAGRPWCDGNVGMSGLSYLGLVQWAAAAQRPPSLRTIIPINIGTSHATEQVCFTGGAFNAGYVLWLITQFFGPETARRRALAGETDAAEMLRVLKAGDDVEGLTRYRPLSKIPLLQENPVADWYHDVVRDEALHDPDPEALRAHYAAVEIPALNVSGWYDYFLSGTLHNYTQMRADGGSEAARNGQRLLIGPWDHLLNSTSAQYDFGFAASTLASDFSGYQLQHFARYLQGDEHALEEAPAVRIFVMGENAWRDEESWPLERSRPQPWYLRAGGPGADGGLLSPESPDATERPDHYSTTRPTRRRHSAAQSVFRAWPRASTSAPTTSVRMKRAPTSSSTPPRCWTSRSR